MGPEQYGDAGAVGEGQPPQIQSQQGGEGGVDPFLQLLHDLTGGVVIQFSADADGERAVFLCADKAHRTDSFPYNVFRENYKPFPGRKRGEGHETTIYFLAAEEYHGGNTSFTERR